MLVEPQKPVSPLIKWVGGKRTLLSEIIPRIERSGFTGRYFEPFIGGGAVFFGLTHRVSSISDLNKSLIHFYEKVRDSSHELLLEIQNFNVSYSELDSDSQKDMFYKIRERFNERTFDLEHAADFYILNKLSFNGLYRESAKGNFNTPFGKRTTLPLPEVENWNNASNLLGQATITVQSFQSACDQATSGDFVYFDPPYIPLTPTSSFTSYSADGFGEQQQIELAALCRNLSERNVSFLLSNSDTEITRRIFDGFEMTEISAQRLVSARAKGRNSVQELLVSNFSQK